MAITHGPPKGIIDYANDQRAGSLDLFGAIAHQTAHALLWSHPRGWGAKLVAWRQTVSEKPSYMTGIDNGNSTMVQRLSIVRKNAHNTNYQTSHCSDDSHPVQRGAHTLFVNAAMEGATDEYPVQPPCLTDLELPRAG